MHPTIQKFTSWTFSLIFGSYYSSLSQHLVSISHLSVAGFGILCFLCKTERFLSVSVANSGIASFILAKEIPLSLVLRPPVACHAVVAGIYIQHPESPPPPRTNPSILLHLHLHQHLHRLRRYSFRPSSFVLFVAVWASLSCCQVALKVSLRRIAALSLLHQQLQLHPHPHPLLLLRLQLQLKLKAKPKLYSEGIKCKYPCPGCTCAASSSSSPPPASPHPIPLLRHRMLPVGNWASAGNEYVLNICRVEAQGHAG